MRMPMHFSQLSITTKPLFHTRLQIELVNGYVARRSTRSKARPVRSTHMVLGPRVVLHQRMV